MKYLRRFNESINRSEIDAICKKYGIEHYTINDDDSIDVDGNVNLIPKCKIDKLPLKFGKVNGNFICGDLGLISLEGAPLYVGGDFKCYNNKLTSLKYAPKYVGEDFKCYKNRLDSLEYISEYIGRDIYCGKNNLYSLKGISKSFKGKLNCCENEIKNIDYLPNNCNMLNIMDNPIFIILQLFVDYNDYNISDKLDFDLMQDFNDREIIQNDIVIIDRLVEFLEDIGEPRTKEYLQNLLENEYETR